MNQLNNEIARHPDDPKLLWKMGQTALEGGSFLLASRCFEAALALDPNFEPARASLAALRAAQPDLARAPGRPTLFPPRSASHLRRPARLPDRFLERKGWDNDLGSLSRGNRVSAPLLPRVRRLARRRQASRLAFRYARWSGSVSSFVATRRFRSTSGSWPRRSPGFGDNLTIVSIGGVTGLDLVATRANPAQPQAPSPFRFAEIAQEAGIEFVHFSGMTEERTPRLPTAPVWPSSITTTTASSTSISRPGRSCRWALLERAQPPLQEPGRQSLPGRHRRVGTRIRRLLPRHRRRRHRQRRRPGCLPLQLRRERALSQ